jgi:transcriptional repressor NrdR
VRCPKCGSLDDRVVDTRQSEDGTAVRRRRECLTCQRRFTTYERLESPLIVKKRSGDTELFDKDKIIKGIMAASKNRPIDQNVIEDLASQLEDKFYSAGTEITTQEIGKEVLNRLRKIDEVVYMRFASVYKGFEGVKDFEAEALLLTKSTEPKKHST